jgi:hypothetical protein
LTAGERDEPARSGEMRVAMAWRAPVRAWRESFALGGNRRLSGFVPRRRIRPNKCQSAHACSGHAQRDRQTVATASPGGIECCRYDTTGKTACGFAETQCQAHPAKINFFPKDRSYDLTKQSRASQEGCFAIATTRGAGCDGRVGPQGVRCSAYGQAVWYECRRFEVPEVLAASPNRNFKSKAALESMFGQRLCFPKFAE